MIIGNENNEATLLFNHLLKINKPLKSIPINIPKVKPKYFIDGYTFIAYEPDLHFIQVTGEIKLPKKLELLSEYFEHEDFKFIIDSESLFQFSKTVKDSKLDIDSIIIENGSITFNTTGISELTMEVKNISKEFEEPAEVFYDILEKAETPLFDDYNIDISNLKDDEFIKSFWLIVTKDSEEIEFKPYTYVLQEGEHGVLLRPKDFIEKTTSSTYTMSGYAIDELTGLYFINIDNTNFNLTEIIKVALI